MDPVTNHPDYGVSIYWWLDSWFGIFAVGQFSYSFVQNNNNVLFFFLIIIVFALGARYAHVTSLANDLSTPCHASENYWVMRPDVAHAYSSTVSMRLYTIAA